MDDELQYLVHFFHDKEHLFKTITMVGISQMEEICNTMSAEKRWYWGRYAQSERQTYLHRRLFVEKELYEGYTHRYGSLKEKTPVYFYLYPNLTEQKAMELGHQRTMHDEIEPQVLMVKIQDIKDTKNMTFTLNDSFKSYWKKAVDAGLEIRGDANDHIVLPDHNKVFPFSMIEEIHRTYKEYKLSYEIQIWDYQLLRKIRYTILGEEEPYTLPITSSG